MDYMVEERVCHWRREMKIEVLTQMKKREEDFVVGECVLVSSSLLDRSTKSCLGRIMVSLIFLEGLEEEACVDAIEVEEK
ncbi:hypothetical protein Tco_1011039 [Tanacetum coccineum]